MAEVLYRIGAAAARRGWRVLAAWVAVIAVTGAAFGLGHGTLSNNFDIPGTASARVIDELQRELPAFAGGSGLVVLHTDDGSPFSAAQKAAYSDLIARATTELPDVATVVDPFATEQLGGGACDEVRVGGLLGRAEGRPVVGVWVAAGPTTLTRRTLSPGHRLIESRLGSGGPPGPTPPSSAW